MAITNDTRDIADQVRRELIRLNDDQIADLTQVWVEEWDGVEGEVNTLLVAAITGAIAAGVYTLRVSSSVPAQGAMAAISRAVDRSVTRSAPIITAPLPRVVSGTTRAQQAEWATQLPPGPALPTQQRNSLSGVVDGVASSPVVDEVVTRFEDRAAEKLRGVPADVSARVQSHIERGLRSGTNPEDVARNIVRDIEASFNGGLSRASRIARTEMLDAHREVARVNRMANDAVSGWVWICSLDGLVCPACLENHGEVFPADQFGPEDHPNGRCYAQDKLKSWEELGISGLDEPDDDLGMTGEDYFNNLTEESKKAMLGPTRFDAWKNGDISFGEFSQKVDVPGWRPYYRVKPVK